MKNWREVKKNFQSFIRFGEIMIQPAREDIARIIFYFFYDAFEAADALDNSEYRLFHENWYDLVKQILDNSVFAPICCNNVRLSIMVTEDILEWLKKIHRRWQRNVLRQAVARPINEKESENQHQKRKNKVQKGFLQKSFPSFITFLNNRYHTLKKLHNYLSPFFEFFGNYWDLSQGVWHNINWHQFEKYAEILEKESGLQELADLLGKYRKIERELEIELCPGQGSWKTANASKSEIIGVHFSNDIDNILPSEISLLSCSETEVLFSKNYVEKKLLTFQYRGASPISRKKIKKIEEKKGPIIICIDTSASMTGIPEKTAKIITLALLSRAIKEQRSCYLITFSTQIRVLDLTKILHSLPKIIDFLAMSFRGGTDLTPALQEACKTLNKKEYRYADTLVISDFYMPDFLPEMEREIERQKNRKKNRFHSLTIVNRLQNMPRNFEKLQSIFDYHWIYHPENPDSFKGTIKHLREITSDS